MKRAKKWLIVSLVLSCLTTVSAQCVDTISLCQYGKNSIPFLSEDDSVKIRFINSKGLSSPYFYVASLDSQIVFSTNFDLTNAGYYSIFIDSLWSCLGYYTASACADELYLDDLDRCNVVSAFNCVGDSINDHYDLDGFCEGDTVMYQLFDDNLNDTIYRQPFSPDRLQLGLGTLISYTDSTFSIAFTASGQECIQLRTVQQNGDTVFTHRPIQVMPTKAANILYNGAVSTEAEVCEGDSLHLKYDLVSSNYTIWFVNNNYYGEGKKLDVSFQQAGEYIIQVFEDTGCNCTPVSYFKLIVKETKRPPIKCVRTVCLNEEVTYTSDITCDTYLWKISEGGVIIDGGGPKDNYVSVKWVSSYSNAVTLETPSCLNAKCEKPFTQSINIIDPQVHIDGAIEVCDKTTVVYKAPLYTGTSYNWQLSGHGRIVSGQGSNSIIVNWSTDVLAHEKVIVSYSNCNIDCEGHAELDATIKPMLFLNNSNLTLCQDHAFTFTNSLGMDVRWTVKTLDSTLIKQYNGKALDVTFNKSGQYLIAMVDTTMSTCNTNVQSVVEVLPFLKTPSTIFGGMTVCQNESMQYQVGGLSQWEVVYWSIYDGDTLVPIISKVGLDIYYTWTTSGPYKISAYKKNTLTGCESGVYSIYPQNINSIFGANHVCIGNDAYYQLQTYNGETLAWTISPSDAGKITSSSGGWIRVNWKKVGSHTIKTKYCGKDVVFTVKISSRPIVDVVYDQVVCSGEKSKVIVNVKPDETFTISQNGQILSQSNPSYLNGGTYYNISVTNGSCVTTRNIYIYSQPLYDINITMLGPNITCPPMVPQTIFMENPSPNFTYEWFLNGIKTGSNKAEITTTNYGIYSLKITDNYGCTAISNAIKLEDCCDTFVLNHIVPSLKIKKTDKTCVTKNFKVLPPYVGSKFTWYFDMKNNTSIVKQGTNVTHTYTKAGIYLVLVESDAPCVILPATNCSDEAKVCERAFVYVEIPVAAGFYIFDGCTNQSMLFRNTSTSTSNVAALKYQWDFGDPSSGSSNQSTLTDPNHTFTKAGQYKIRLIASEPNGCSDTAYQNIFIYETPKETISSRDEFCVSEMAKFIALGNTSGVTYYWNFGDPSSGSKNVAYSKTPTHQYSSPGLYDVQLTASTFNGACKVSRTKTILVVNNYLTGSIVCNTPLPKCPLDSAKLSAPLGNYTYLWSNGETTPSIKVAKTGPYYVTITHNESCAYIPPAFNVVNHEIVKSQIYSKKYFTKNAYNIYYDSLTICQGDSFEILCPLIPTAKYKWSNGYITDNELKYNAFLKTLCQVLIHLHVLSPYLTIVVQCRLCPLS